MSKWLLRHCGIAAALAGTPGCKAPAARPEGAETLSATSGEAGASFQTFATTYESFNQPGQPEYRYACGYLKNQIDSFRSKNDLYYAAISKMTYDPQNCGRIIELTVKSQCLGAGSHIDRGYCVPGGAVLRKKVRAIIVDRCPDAMKCVAPSDENRAAGHEVRHHVDFGPQSQARTEIGSDGNYDISWTFTSEAYDPMAYIVDSVSNPQYVRIGLIMAKGVRKVRVPVTTLKGTGASGSGPFGGQEFGPNDTQAEFGSYVKGIRDALKAGLAIEVTHADGTVKHYRVTSSLTAPKLHFNENIYAAAIREAAPN